MEKLFFFLSIAQNAIIGSWKKKICCENYSLVSCFGQLIESIEKCFVCFLFSMPTVTALFSPGLTLAVLSLCEVYKE